MSNYFVNELTKQNSFKIYIALRFIIVICSGHILLLVRLFSRALYCCNVLLVKRPICLFIYNDRL